MKRITDEIKQGRTTIGIELGSTRIKAVLIDSTHEVVAQGNYDWENSLVDGYWTYSLEDVQAGVQGAFTRLADDVSERYGTELKTVRSLGVSAMMHGYLAFDAEGRLLAPFRTWRNTNTDVACEKLSEVFQFNIPHRWSIAHLYQAMLDGEQHVGSIAYLTTLAGYVHWQLTGRKVLGVGDAAGMFPIADGSGQYDSDLLACFNELPEVQALGLRVETILPEVLTAGEEAGQLTAEGAAWLDPRGKLAAGCLLCPPEGDAGTGMVATNTITERTGNVSAGTSIFAMVVLEQALSDYYPEVDMVTTPDGKPVAMVHCNNGTPETDAWVRVFGEMAEAAGQPLASAELYHLLYNKALEADPTAGGLISVNYLAGEPIGKVHEGRPMYIRRPDSTLNLANFMLSQLYSIFATLKLGLDLLVEQEAVVIDELLGHGGIFKTEGVMQTIMASALEVPTAVYRSAGEGGAWGIALLAAYAASGEGSLDAYLSQEVFTTGHERTVIEPDPKYQEGFAVFLDDYRQVLKLQQQAAEILA